MCKRIVICQPVKRKAITEQKKTVQWALVLEESGTWLGCFDYRVTKYNTLNLEYDSVMNICEAIWLSRKLQLTGLCFLWGLKKKAPNLHLLWGQMS